MNVQVETQYLDTFAFVSIIMHVWLMNIPTSSNPKVDSLHRPTSLHDGDFLLFLGKRVRQLRNLRGMTRKTVARESDVSERHLAQLEARRKRLDRVAEQDCRRSERFTCRVICA